MNYAAGVVLLLALLTSSPGSLAGSRWTLVQIAPRGQAITPGVRLRRPTLNFMKAGGLVSGDTGCNGYSASWWASGERLRISRTRLRGESLCPDRALGLEADFVELLKNARSFTLNGSSLTVHGPGHTFMTFKRVNAQRPNSP